MIKLLFNLNLIYFILINLIHYQKFNIIEYLKFKYNFFIFGKFYKLFKNEFSLSINKLFPNII